MHRAVRRATQRSQESELAMKGTIYLRRQIRSALDTARDLIDTLRWLIDPPQLKRIPIRTEKE